MDNPKSLPAQTTRPAGTSNRKLKIASYMAVVFLFWVSLFIYVPTLPTYVQSKVDNLAVVGVVLAMYGLWQAVLRLPVGIIADWWGRRKPFIVAGLVFSGLGAWLMAIAGDAVELGAGRAMIGVAAAAWVPLVAGFSSLFPAHQAVRATAILTVVFSAGRVVATSMTGFLNEWGGYSPAFYAAAGAAALAVIILLPTREQRRPAKRPSVQGIGRLITRKDVLLPSLLAAINLYVDWTTAYGFSPILVKQLGGSDIAQSMLVTLHITATIVGNLGTTLLVNRLDARRLVLLGFGLSTSGLALAAYAPALAALFVAHILLGLAYGVSYPVLMGLSIQYVDDSERTTAMGLHQAVYAIGIFAGPWISGLLANAFGIQPMYAITAVGCLALSWLGVARLSAPPAQL